MARRIRTIKPEILDSESTALLSDAAWRLFVSMITLADDLGNLSANEAWLSAQVFWSRNRTPIRELLVELEAAGHIEGYRVRGKSFCHIVKWADHQRVDKPNQGKVAKPEEAEEVIRFSVNPREHSRILAESSTVPREEPTEDWKGKEGTGKEGKEQRGKRAPQVPNESFQVVDAWKSGWLERFKPDRGVAPEPDGPDWKAAKNLVTKYGLERVLGYVSRFLNDTDKLVAGRGHMLRDLPSRIARYEKGAETQLHLGRASPRTDAVTETVDETDLL